MKLTKGKTVIFTQSRCRHETVHAEPQLFCLFSRIVTKLNNIYDDDSMHVALVLSSKECHSALKNGIIGGINGIKDGQ